MTRSGRPSYYPLIFSAMSLIVAGCSSTVNSDGGGDSQCATDTCSRLDATDAQSDIAQPSQFGQPCTQNQQCESGICLMIGRCSRTCAMRSDCPASTNWQCANIPG